MIVGAWPTDELDLRDYTERLAGWQLKALREAKLATDWTAPDLEDQDAARSFLYTIMADEEFVADASAFARRIGPPGAVNGLAQTLLKLTVPGVPDIYQGAEFWDRAWSIPTMGGRWISRGAFSNECRCVTDRAVDVLAGWQGEAGGDPPRAHGAPRGSGTVRMRGVSPGRVSGPLAAHVVAFLHHAGTHFALSWCRVCRAGCGAARRREWASITISAGSRTVHDAAFAGRRYPTPIA